MVIQKSCFFHTGTVCPSFQSSTLGRVFVIEAENKSLSLSTQITSAASPGHSASAAQRQTDPHVPKVTIME